MDKKVMTKLLDSLGNNAQCEISLKIFLYQKTYQMTCNEIEKKISGILVKI